MLGDRHFTRIDTVDIKIQLVQKLGNQKAGKYFNLLNRFFSLKLRKTEFDRLCIATIGRENLGIHNCLIRSIVKNAALAKTPPPKGSKFESSLNGKVANGYQRSCLQSLCRDVLPPSPRKVRTPALRDRKFKDRPSPLGPHGKPQAVGGEDTAPKIHEQQSATELLSLGSRPLEVNSVEDGEEVDQAAGSPGIHSRSPVTAPLGIPRNVKGMRKVVVVAGSSPSVCMETCLRKRELPDTTSLRKRLEQKFEKDGIKISLDSMNLLNSGLDVFLKRLIKPSLELASSQSTKREHNQVVIQTMQGINGTRPVRYIQREIKSYTASMLDFRTAMEMNPTILGEDWPMQLEKVCLQELEERNGR